MARPITARASSLTSGFLPLTSSSSATASERSPPEAVRHRREARTGEHREHANQSAAGNLLKYFYHEKGGNKLARRRLQRFVRSHCFASSALRKDFPPSNASTAASNCLKARASG